MAKKMNEAALRTVIERAISQSDWHENSEIQGNQEAALRSYLNRDQSEPIPGEADTRSHDVADMVEAVTAQIMPAFKSDEIALFEAHGPLDVQQSRLESKICNQMLFDVNDGELELQAAVRDGLLLRNAIVKVYVEDAIDVGFERYQKLSSLELAQVQEPTAELQDVEITALEARDTEDIDLTIRRTTTFRRLNIEAIDPVNFIIEREWTSINPAEASLVGEQRFEHRGELLRQGFNKRDVEGLKATDSDVRIGSTARNRNQTVPSWHTTDKSMDRIAVFELYIRVDFDGDGVAERRRIIYAGQVTGGTILANEPHSWVPYACGTPFLYPHRFQGLSVFDKLRDLEVDKTKALTQWTNNLQNANFPELVIADGQVADLDTTDRKASGIIRADNVNAVKEIMVPDLGRSSIAYLQYFDKVRAERGGAALDMQSAQAQIAGESAYGVERLVTPREMLANLMADTLGSTLVKQMFFLIHKNLREFFAGKHDFHVGEDQFVIADPSQWAGRSAVRVTGGMSEHQRQQERAALSEMLLQQEKLHGAGMDGILMDLDTYYETLIAWGKAGGIRTPRRFWVNPQSDAAKQAQQQKQQQAQQAQAAQQKQTDKIFDTQVLMSDRDNRTSLVKHLTSLRFDYWNGVLQSEMEELRVQAQGSEDARPDPVLIDQDQATGRESPAEATQ